MKHCSSCNTNNPDNFTTCWSCGKILPEAPKGRDAAKKNLQSTNTGTGVVCKTCHKQIAVNAWSCPTCGAPNAVYRRRVLLPLFVCVLLIIVLGIAFKFVADHRELALKEQCVVGAKPHSKSVSQRKNSETMPEKRLTPSLFGVELGITVDPEDSAQMESLGVVDVKAGGEQDYYMFQPKNVFRTFAEYHFTVDRKSNRISSVGAVSRGPFTDKSVKDETNILLTLMKAKYMVPRAYVKEDHFGGSAIWDSHEFTVEVNARYSFKVVRSYSRAKGYELSVTVHDSMSNLNSDDVNAL